MESSTAPPTSSGPLRRRRRRRGPRRQGYRARRRGLRPWLPLSKPVGGRSSFRRDPEIPRAAEEKSRPTDRACGVSRDDRRVATVRPLRACPRARPGCGSGSAGVAGRCSARRRDGGVARAEFHGRCGHRRDRSGSWCLASWSTLRVFQPPFGRVNLPLAGNLPSGGRAPVCFPRAEWDSDEESTASLPATRRGRCRPRPAGRVWGSGRGRGRGRRGRPAGRRSRGG